MFATRTLHLHLHFLLGGGSWVLAVWMAFGAVVQSLRASESSAAILWADPDLKSFYWENPGFTNIFEGERVVRNAISVAMCAAEPHGLALHRDGTVSFWGYGAALSNGVPNNLRGVVAVAPLVRASVALLDDRNLVAWASPEGPLEVIAGDVKSLAYGYDHVVALRTDGTVRSWSKLGWLTTPKGLRDVVSVAAAGNLAGALRADGTVVTWSAPTDDKFSIAPPDGLSDVERLYAGPRNFYAVRRDGSLVTWGWFTQSSFPPPDPDVVKDVVQVSEHDNYVLLLRTNGIVASWGWMDSADVIAERARVPDGLSNVVAVAAGYSSALALKSDGTLVSWRGSPKESPIPEIASVNVTSIQAGGFMRLSVGTPTRPDVFRRPDDDVVHQWQSGQFEVGARGFGLQFQWYTNGIAVPGATESKFHVDGSIVGTSEGAVAQVSVEVESPDGQRVSTDPVSLTVIPTIQPGTVLEWGPGGARERVIPREIQGRAVAITQGLGGAGAILDDGTLCAWTSDKEPYWRHSPGWPWIKSFGVGLSDVGLVSSDGSARIENPFEQTRAMTLGNAPSGGAASIYLGEDHGVVFLEDGTIRMTGESGEHLVPNVLGVSILDVSYNGGLLGLLMRDGTVQFPYSPNLNAQASGLSGVLALATGWGHALLLRQDGTLVALGDNEKGQCSIPPGLDHVVAVAAGRYHSVALRDDGSVLAWGRLYPDWPAGWPDLGPGEAASVPPGLRGVSAISAKGSQTLFLLGTPMSPRVRLVRAPGGIEAVWPTQRGDWRLQSSAGLFESTWETLPELHDLSGPWSHVRLGESATSAFLRLIQP